uniref:MADF domain-containing protein n=1 Tax=Knipowitschia caucasica TaxID=637954 RepID=A0AAV2J9L3_KNICA
MISSMMGVKSEDCKKRWRQLRDSFVRHKKNKLTSGSGGGTTKEWKWEKEISFILLQLSLRSTQASLEGVEEDEDQEEEEPQICDLHTDRVKSPSVSE